MKYLTLLPLLFFLQCNGQNLKVKVNTGKTLNDTVIISSGTFILSPNLEEIKQLKKKHGEQGFYVIADDANYYKAEIIGLLEQKVDYPKFSILNFKNEPFILDKKKYEDKWLAVTYQKGSKPKIFSLVDYYSYLINNNGNYVISQKEKLYNYENDVNYFIKIFDINGDKINDKIISHKKYKGNDLLIFLGKKNGQYKFLLKSTNFSQDGGNQVSEINKTSAGFVIITSFPDKGFLECEYYIEYKENKWFLRNSIYKTKSSNKENAFIYKCDVTQNLDYSNPNLKVNSMPDENEREKVCTKEFNKDVNKSGLIYIIKDSSGYYNLRKGKNNNSEILQKIKTGEVVNVLYSKGDWWLIETKEKKRGYAFKDKVVIKN